MRGLPNWAIGAPTRKPYSLKQAAPAFHAKLDLTSTPTCCASLRGIPQAPMPLDQNPVTINPYALRRNAEVSMAFAPVRTPC